MTDNLGAVWLEGDRWYARVLDKDLGCFGDWAGAARAVLCYLDKLSGTAKGATDVVNPAEKKKRETWKK